MSERKYDSLYGNTEQIAQAIGDGLTGDVDPSELKTGDLLILGSPTHGGFPTESIYGLLKAPLALDGVNVAAFDTRTKTTLGRIGIGICFDSHLAAIVRLMQAQSVDLVLMPHSYPLAEKPSRLVSERDIARSKRVIQEMAQLYARLLGKCKWNHNTTAAGSILALLDARFSVSWNGWESVDMLAVMNERRKHGRFRHRERYQQSRLHPRSAG